MLEQLLQTGLSLYDLCGGIAFCGPWQNWLIILGACIGAASAGLVLFRRLRKPAVITKQPTNVSNDA